MAPMKSIITPIEKNPDGTVKQKAIITGAIPKQSKFQPRMQSHRPVTYATTPLKRRSNLTPVRPQQVATKLRSGLTPVKSRQAADMMRQKGCLQKAGIFPLRPTKKGATITIHENVPEKGANSTFEITKSLNKSQMIQKKQTANQQVSKPGAVKSRIPLLSYATTRRRRSSILVGAASGTSSEQKKIKSKIPVPVNPVTVPLHIHTEVSTVQLMKREKDLVEEITAKQKELASVREMLRKRLDIKYDGPPHESPALAYNLRRPSLSAKRADKLRLEMEFSPTAGTPSPGKLPPDVLLSISKSKTPGSIFENYRRNCAALRSPSTVIRKRRSRSLSVRRGDSSISERVFLQLNNLYA